MKGLREFQIDIFSLTHKLHEFEFEITDKLFTQYEESLLEKGEGVCKVTLQKSETMMALHFDIDAKVELTCDRSLDKFWQPVKLKEDLIIKFGDENYALSDDVLVIRNDTPSINVGEYIYEFISLAIPMKKLHPRYQDEEEQSDLIYSSGKDQKDKKGEIDPRWEALKRLKGNN